MLGEADKAGEVIEPYRPDREPVVAGDGVDLPPGRSALECGWVTRVPLRPVIPVVLALSSKDVMPLLVAVRRAARELGIAASKFLEPD